MISLEQINKMSEFILSGKRPEGETIDELLVNVRNTLMMFFGGPQKFDDWLNYTADTMADNRASTPIDLPPHLAQYGLNGLMSKPKEVIDEIIRTAESFRFWTYSFRYIGRVMQVIDNTSGNVIEEADVKDYQRLHDKYGAFLSEGDNHGVS